MYMPVRIGNQFQTVYGVVRVVDTIHQVNEAVRKMEQNDIKVKILDIPCNFSAAFYLNCCKICNSCLFLQFPFFIYIINMPGYYRFITLKQIFHLIQTQPNSFTIKHD